MPAPPQVHYETRPRYGLIAGGLSVLGASYLITAFAASVASDVCNDFGCRTEQWPIFIPIAGPFLQMGYVSGSGANTARFFLAFDGLVQTAGALMTILGIAYPNKVAVYSNRMQVLPYATNDGGGLAVAGHF